MGARRRCRRVGLRVLRYPHRAPRKGNVGGAARCKARRRPAGDLVRDDAWLRGRLPWERRLMGTISEVGQIGRTRLFTRFEVRLRAFAAALAVLGAAAAFVVGEAVVAVLSGLD